MNHNGATLEAHQFLSQQQTFALLIMLCLVTMVVGAILPALTSILLCLCSSRSPSTVLASSLSLTAGKHTIPPYSSLILLNVSRNIISNQFLTTIIAITRKKLFHESD
jgi:hypothetical protein